MPAGDPSKLAARAGLPVARAYWPCLLTWTAPPPPDETLERMGRMARRADARSMLVPLSPRTQLLLVGDDAVERMGRQGLDSMLSALLEAGGGEASRLRVNAVVGQPIASDEPLSSAAVRLSRLARYALARDGGGVARAPGSSFASLLDTLDARYAHAFQRAQLARIADYDHEHGTNLQRVLELALDHDNRNTAARAAYMHRNTFRRQLRRALRLVDADLACPEERLALHLALKLRALGRPGNGAMPPSRGSPSLPGRDVPPSAAEAPG